MSAPNGPSRSDGRGGADAFASPALWRAAPRTLDSAIASLLPPAPAFLVAVDALGSVEDAPVQRDEPRERKPDHQEQAGRAGGAPASRLRRSLHPLRRQRTPSHLMISLSTLSSHAAAEQKVEG